MPPRNTKPDTKGIETRKVKAASKKKDPAKITEVEFQRLLEVFTEKLNRLQAIFRVDLPKVFKDLNRYNQFGKTYQLCGVNFLLNCEFVIKMVDENLHIEFTCLYEPIEDSFVFDLEKPHNLMLGSNKFNPFRIFDTWISKIYSLFLDKHYDDGLDEYIVTKNNINDAIKDIDSALSIFYINPTIGSPTGNFTEEYITFVDKIKTLNRRPRYTIIKEHKLYNKFTNGGALADCSLVIRLGERERNDTYQISIKFGRSTSGDDSLTIMINKWSDQTGWIRLDHFTSKLLILGSDSVSLKIESNHTYNSGGRYSKMLEFALEYIHKFSGFEPNYMFMNKDQN